MAVQETIVDRAPIDHNPPDPNVIAPKHVRDAAAAAEAIHAQQYPVEPQPQPEPQPEPQPQPPADPTITATVNEPQPQPQQHDFVDPAQPQDLKDSVWASRYNSMRGRWEATTREVGQLQELVTQLGGELRAMQTAAAGQGQQPSPQNTPRSHEKLITDRDRETFGEDLLDVAARAAREAVAPELDALRAANADMNKRVVTTAQGELRASLAASVPNWIAINRSPAFRSWLSLRNPYTGAVRGTMLNEAYRAANAPQVIATFRDFVNEVKATGGELPGSRTEQQTAPGAQQPAPIAPREPAIPLETLAAPGRARPAGGDSQLPADKPNYTRTQISGFYRDVRRGVYAGREIEKNRIEQDIIAAQAEGRVR